ncbi:membrane-associated proteins in eicosanoid and glutathione metabolism [Cutaneotrichosporon oleaginosum]|uniref:Membrane-associated proteins in eicosanoid and glutathione metabolism n=1 Tax=Cutaneotrichosporon oleaginosum TaxID=879819 RepID=A0A0J0XT60_9TREE|nr:membrane-associated proteins in eicosanoid and glutathione metabolism [Cutaneotrichosporon oleaginosum]KLT44276.1 membrane-associated proteins in eicosanoid and glutathione metabolism [Cutaneotrichosporon oleaginosum]TXT11556.1 hypothetical protein COLE_01966 [Cutaneotrichosporon oleaginosum]
MATAHITPGFTLPATFPVMGVGVVALLFLNVFQLQNVVKARKAAGVKYPALYASEEEARADPKKKLFNCAQRAHANTLEYLPTVLSLFAFLGCFHPKLATGSILAWTLSRFSYTIGYSSGDPAKRNAGLGRLGLPALCGLIFPTMYVVGVEVYRLFLA